MSHGLRNSLFLEQSWVSKWWAPGEENLAFFQDLSGCLRWKEPLFTWLYLIHFSAHATWVYCPELLAKWPIWTPWKSIRQGQMSVNPAWMHMYMQVCSHVCMHVCAHRDMHLTTSIPLQHLSQLHLSLLNRAELDSKQDLLNRPLVAWSFHWCIWFPFWKSPSNFIKWSLLNWTTNSSQHNSLSTLYP